MDFGVARTSVQDHLSNVGTVRGKPSYMAPEQVTGNKLTAQTDVFALGIVMYETACLRRLFGRGEPTKSMAAVVKHEPRPLESIIPGFPKALDEIISQALEKKPENRQQDAGELFRQLSDVLRTLPEVSTIDRDLSRIVEESFGPNAFDIDTKISEFARAEEPLPPTAEETRSDRSPISSPVQDEEDPQGAAFYEALATNVFWPGAPDTGPGLSPPETYSAAFQEQGAAPLSQNRGKLSIVLLLAAFILSFALVVGVQRRQQSPKAVTTSETKKPFPLKAKTVNKATVTPNGIQQVATPKPAIKAEPQAKQNPAKPKKKKITTRTEEIREGAGKQTKKKKRATKNEVYALIKKLQAKDPEKAAQYQTTLIETGNNQKRLESLRSRVVKALRNSD
jgi:serine/threonine protein kinase